MDNPVSQLVFFVNGQRVVECNPDPEWTILYYFREKLKLFGVKLGCSEGGCGSCTVMISKYNRVSKKIYHFCINTCLLSVCSLHGLAVTTAEGIGNPQKLHPVQERIAKAHGSQCGFCTPGIVMAMYALLRNNQKPTMNDINITLQGNLCRCTGYRSIIEGYRTFADGDCPTAESSCKTDKDGKKLFDEKAFIKYNPSQDLIFPPELRCDNELDKQFLIFQGKTVTWFRPLNLEELLVLKQKYPEAKLVLGSTEIGVDIKFKKTCYPVLIHISSVPELKEISSSCCVIRVGAAVTINELKCILQKEVDMKKPYKTRVFAAILDMINYFGGEQVRNVAGIGGNIMNSSPISDLNQIFLAANCILEVNSKTRGLRKVKMDNTFFTGYRKNVLLKDEIIIAINIPFTTHGQHFYAYKQSKRRDDDIAIVNAAINITVTENKITDVKLAYGGMAVMTVTTPRTEEALLGEVWNENILNIAYQNLIEDLPLPQTSQGGMVSYRKALALSLFFRAYLAISSELGLNIPASYKSGIKGFKYQIPGSSQYYEMAPNQSCTDSVGRPVVHRAAFQQTLGKALYTDDLPAVNGELYAGLILSTHTYAEINRIDSSKALDMEGVHAFFCANDLDPKKNKFGSVTRDEDIFASKHVTCHGQLIGMVLADNQMIAQKAARKVVVEYTDICSPVISIDDAIKKNSYFSIYKIENDCIEKILEASDHVIEGEVRTGAQEHFYLEPFSAIVLPKVEDNEIEIIASTQNPTEIANMVAQMLDVPINRVVCKVKRCGGGFGGKETRTALLILPLAFAARTLNRPVRCTLDRDEDMILTGKRHPFLIKYKIGFSTCGILTALDVQIYNNGGNSLDLSSAVMLRSMLHIQNAYKIPACRVYGYACKTNLPSNTAFRGYGCPQAMFAIETIIRRVADFLDRDAVQISAMNFQQEGDVTHYNQQITNCTVQRCWDECLQKVNYPSLKKQVEEFNSENRWKKRGVAVVPTMYGIAFSVAYHNQAGAIVNVYTDGSVLISHGGVELGQGLHTKMIQIASRVLEIPIDNIYIYETSTDKVPNTTSTAASSASDLNGMAVKNACEEIMERIKPFKEKNPNGSFKDWASEAFFCCTSLSATGYFNICPEIKYNLETNQGTAFNYYTCGAACSVVEIDCLTGDHQVLKTEIVMDLGESLNPAIDIGQIEGAFVQGYGLFTMEEVLYSPAGMLLTKTPGTYKIPGFTDIPLQFNVSLLKGAPNPKAVYSSKAVGEPPLFLSSSVPFAIREAIKSARKDSGNKDPLQMNAPYTVAKIRLACTDNITRLLECAFKVGPDMPWNVEI